MTSLALNNWAQNAFKCYLYMSLLLISWHHIAAAAYLEILH